jgi:hypothetical protein
VTADEKLDRTSQSRVSLCTADSKFCEHFARVPRCCEDCAVRDLAVLLLHLLATVARLAGPGGARSVVPESVLVKHQLLILNRSRKRAPNLRPSDRAVAALCALFMRPGRLIRAAIVLRTSTLLNLHRAHAGLDGRTPDASVDPSCARASLSTYQWQRHCCGLYQTPIAA